MAQKKPGRPQEKVHIPLGFKEAVSDLLKVKPADGPKQKRKTPPTKRPK